MLRTFSGFVALLSVVLSAAPASAQQLYWITGTARIDRSNPDGSGHEWMVKLAGSPIARGVAIDPVDEKLYWCQGGWIRRANLELPEGENFETRTDIVDLLQTNADCGDIVIDVINRKMILGSDSQTAMRRANLDGSNVETIVGSQDGGAVIRGMALYQPSGSTPAIGTIGLGVIVVAMLGVGGALLRRRREIA